MNYLVLELHKQEPWYSNKIVGFKPLPLIWVNAWSKYNVDPRVKTRPEGHSWGSNKKKYINKSLTRIFRANNDNIGICKIWRNDTKSPVWITEWNQRGSSTIKEIDGYLLIPFAASHDNPFSRAWSSVRNFTWAVQLFRSTVRNFTCAVQPFRYTVGNFF